MNSLVILPVSSISFVPVYLLLDGRRPMLWRVVFLVVVLLQYQGCNQPDSARSNSTSSVSLSDGDNNQLFDNRSQSVSWFLSYVDSQRAATLSSPPPPMGYRCPPTEFKLLGVTRDLKTQPIFEDSMDEVKVFRTTDHKFAVKVTTPIGGHAQEQLLRDRGVLLMLNRTSSNSSGDSRLFPRVYDAGFAAPCALRSITMDFLGWSDLMERYIDHGPLPVAEVVALGVRMMHMLEAVHALGLVHGDIHPGNLVFHDVNAIARTTRLIDFGRAKPYIDPSTGEHIPAVSPDNIKPPPTSELAAFTYNPLWMSVHEMQGFPVSRRDDVFRVIQVLVFLLEGTRSLRVPRMKNGKVVMVIAPRAKLLRKKQLRQFSPAVPQSIVSLYYSTMQMDFSETPNYDALRQDITLT